MKNSTDKTRFQEPMAETRYLEVSYKLAYRTAKQKKPHTMQKHINSCILEAVLLVCGEKEKIQCEKLPLSNNIIPSRVINRSDNIQKNLMQEIKNSSFPLSLQLDESQDVAQSCQLLTFVRYVHNNSIKEDFLFCKSLL